MIQIQIVETIDPARYNIQDLDDALLNDILHSYTDNVASTCTGSADTTTFSFDYPGVNVDSAWNEDFIPFEEGSLPSIHDTYRCR